MNFTVSTTDTLGNQVQYTFYWGDGSAPTTTAYYPSGTTTPTVSHCWTSDGTFVVKVQAQSSTGITSGWSDSFLVYIGPTYQLTVLARDQYGNYGSVPFSLDNGLFNGYTGNTYRVTAGNHQIAVPSQFYDGVWTVYVFQSYYYNGIYDYNNPTTISVTSDETVTAYYYGYPVP